MTEMSTSWLCDLPSGAGAGKRGEKAMSLCRVTISSVLLVTASTAASLVGAQGVPVGDRKVLQGFEDKAIPVHKPRNKLQARTQSLHSVAISPDGAYLLAGERDKGVSVWDWMTGELRGVQSWHDTPVRALAFARVGNEVVSASNTVNDRKEAVTQLWVWELKGERLKKSIVEGELRALSGEVVVTVPAKGREIGKTALVFHHTSGGKLTLEGHT